MTKPLAFIKPMMPTLVDQPPTGEGWTHEIKYDGYRAEFVVDRDVSGAFTRNGHDWTDRYMGIVDAAASLPASTAILDGEMVVQDEAGVSDFQALRRAIAGEPHRLVFLAFDLLHLDGTDLRKLPVEERRRKLAALIGRHDPSAAIQFSEAVAGEGAKVFASAEALGAGGDCLKAHRQPLREWHHARLAEDKGDGGERIRRGGSGAQSRRPALRASYA